MALFSNINNSDDDQERDLFEEIPEEEPKQREPVYTEDDPRYWDKDDDRWDHLRPRRRVKWYLILALAAVAVIGIVVLYIRFFSPNVTQAVQYGYIDSLETRGMIFKTDEGVLLPYKNIMDTISPYGHDFVFSVTDKEVFVNLQRYEQQHRPVRVVYDVYYATVPWRGASRIVITKVDTVEDPSKILPPGWNELNH